MFVYAIQDASVGLAEVPYWVSEGEVWDADDPLVKAHPHLFNPLPKVVRNTTGKTREDYAADASAQPKRGGRRG